MPTCYHADMLTLTGLWRNPDFLRLWAGQTVSLTGAAVTREALPLAAVLTLSATPFDLGLLAAAGAAPALVIGLPAGVWADRLHRRPLMIAADVGRALALVSIPAAAALGALTITHLYVVAAVTGALTLLFDVAWQAYLPTLVRRDQLVEGNSKLGVSSSLAEIGGPALGGALVQAVTAPLALLADALSYVVSAAALADIRTPEPPPKAPEAAPNIRRELAQGLRLVLHDPALRTLTGSAITWTLFGNIIGALYAFYALNELGFSPALLGAVIAAGGIGALGGAVAAEPAARWLGIGRTLAVGLGLSGALALLIPLAQGPLWLAAAMLVTGQVVGDFVLTVYFVNELSLRQTVTPGAFLGRASAAYQLVTAAARPLGALLGGALGQTVGVRPALVVAALGIAAAALWIMASPIWRAAVREQDQPSP